MNAKHTEPLDAADLTKFTGTTQYWRVARQFAITDGVKYLAETAACFWLIDAAISHFGFLVIQRACCVSVYPE